MCPGHLFSRESADKALFTLSLDVSSGLSPGLMLCCFLCWFPPAGGWESTFRNFHSDVADWRRPRYSPHSSADTASSSAVQAGRPGGGGRLGCSQTSSPFCPPVAGTPGHPVWSRGRQLS